MAKQHKTLLGFMAGLAVGMGLFAFLKSEKGEELLSNLKQKAEDLKGDFEDLVARGKEAADDMMNNGDDTNNETA